MKGRLASFPRRNGLALLLAIGLFALVYHTVLRLCVFTSGSDYLSHSVWALNMDRREILASFYDGSERLWHIAVKAVYALNNNMWGAAAIVTAAADTAAYLLLFGFLSKTLPERFPRWLLALAAVSLFVVGSLYIPGGAVYVGAVNTWHNPTNIMVRPFALGIFWMTLRFYDRRRHGRDDTLLSPAGREGGFSFDGSFWQELRRPVYRSWELVVYPLLILLSAYAKPSFLQIFAPAIFLMLLAELIRSRGKLLPFCLKLALAYLPAALIILSQFSSFFSAGVSAGAAEAAEAAAAGESFAPAGIAVYFLQAPFTAGDLARAILAQVGNILRFSAFPLFICCLIPRRFWQNPGGRLTVIAAVVGRAEAMLLHETGYRAAHGNMLWGQYISAWLLWCAGMAAYLLLFRERSAAGRLARWAGTPLLAWHLLSGAAYLIQCIVTQTYFF